jgi:probable rRNA maturation factor
VTIEISNSQSHLAIDSKVVRDLTRRVLEGEGIADASISIAFVDNSAIHAINRRHLNHDWSTDVITFRFSGLDDETLDAELVISAEMAAVTARESGADPRAELMLYLVHGLLHLCGYDDANEDSVAAIRQREDEVLRREGVANTFALVGPLSHVKEVGSWTV